MPTKPSYEQLDQALTLAVSIIMANELGDSRAVSDEAVALCVVSCGLVDAKVMQVIDNALGKTATVQG